jgi:hypothetical protein
MITDHMLGKMAAVEYEQIAAEAAGLELPTGREDGRPPIGETAISDTPTALDAVVAARLAKIRQAIAGAAEIDFFPPPAFDALVAADFLTYPEYRSALASIADHVARFDERAHAHRIAQLERKAETLTEKLDLQCEEDEPGTGAIQTYGELRRLRADITYQQNLFTILPHERRLQALCVRYNPNRFVPSREGYLAYLAEITPAIFTFSKRRLPITLPEVDRQAHTYITGKSGSGKSELLKVLIHTYTNKAYPGSVIVIDPHGEFAEQVAHFPEVAESGRLVYINPALSPYYSPTINPFDISDKSIASIAIYTEQLISVFKRLFELGNYPDLTGHMNAILANCISTLIRTPNSTIRDLILFMNDDTNEHLVQLGLNSPDKDVQDFFAHSFHLKAYETTRSNLSPRIQSLITPPVLRNFLIGQSTINLEEEVNKGKFIIFSLPEGGGKTTMPAIGCFIIALLQGMAMRRYSEHKSDRVPVHVFVDECQYFLTNEVKTILTGARKFGLHLTLAQQQYGQEMDTSLIKTVAGNTAIKIVGMNDEDTLKRFEDRLQVPLEDLRKLERRQFYIKTDRSQKPAIKITVPSELVGFKNSIGAEAWKRAKDEQITKYYRKLSVPTNQVGDEAASDPATTPTPDPSGEVAPSQPPEHAPGRPQDAPRRAKPTGTGKPFPQPYQAPSCPS